MKKVYSNRITSLHESVTIAITSLARELKEQGKDVLSFSAGEPDFPTPGVIKEEAIKAIEDNFTHYTAVAGIPALLEAICHKLQRENHIHYSPDEILVSCGAKHSLFNLFSALIDHNDEVIVPAPYWVTYPELTTYFGGKNVFIQAKEENSFKITPAQLKEAITPKTKLFILNSPANPTGIVYTKEELKALAEVLKGTDIWVLSDEIYEKLTYDGEFISTASINEDMLERTITVNGLSKSVAMTGWRMGYLGTKDKTLRKLVLNLQSQSVSNINSITQKASIVALEGRVDTAIASMCKAFKERRDFASLSFSNIPSLTFVKPQGSFYLFINCSKVEPDSQRFCKELLEKALVAVVPGAAFGADGYFRFSYATNLETIQKGIERIAHFCK